MPGQLDITAHLDITALTDPDGLRVAGVVDLVTMPRWEFALDAVGRRPGDSVIDLVELAFIDVGGLRALAVAAFLLRSEGWRLTLRGPAPRVRRFLDLLGWSELFAYEQCRRPDAGVVPAERAA